MSELENRFVKKGLWINREHGYVMGQTLTVEARTGTVIVALLTILASIGMAKLWDLFTFLYHQYQADGRPADGLKWQQQALLRTMPTPTALMADLLKLSWTWKAKAPRAYIRCLLPFITALCFAIAAIAAGIATAFAIDSSNIEVLVYSPFCARLNYTKVFADRTNSNLLASVKGTIDTYASNCYQNRPSLPAPCRNTFTRPNISFTAVPAPCPWNETLCRGGALPALHMDTGLLDLRSDFGLNVPPDEGVKLQKKTTCSVLPIENRIILRDTAWWTARGFTNPKTTIEYGTYRNTPSILRPEATFVQAEQTTHHGVTYGSASAMNYSQPDDIALGINTIPEMERSDADVSLSVIWLNDIEYEKPVHDPLFLATTAKKYVAGGGYDDVTHYHSDNAAGVIGCAEQYKFCIPQSGKPDFCTPFRGSPLDSFVADFPNPTSVQIRILQLLRTLSRLVKISNGASFHNILAQNTLSGSTSPGLPDDQWVKEVIAWEARVWASYQTLLSTAITGPSLVDEFASEYVEPAVDGDEQLCKSLKMRKSGGYANINVFALAFVITFSLVLTISNTLILRFLIFMSRFRSALAPRLDHWVQDGVFQLQRRAFEAQEQGTWVNLDDEVPVTNEYEKLHELPVENSLALRLDVLARKSYLRKTGTNVTEETVVEVYEEEDAKKEGRVDRHYTGMDKKGVDDFAHRRE